MTKESIVDVTATVKLAPSPVESCTQTEIELHIESVRRAYAGHVDH